MPALEPVPLDKYELQALSKHIIASANSEQKQFLACRKEHPRKPEDCGSEYNALAKSVESIIQEAHSSAEKEFKRYAECLDFNNGKFNVCRPEKAALEAALPVASL